MTIEHPYFWWEKTTVCPNFKHKTRVRNNCKVSASFSSEMKLVEDGEFYLPCGFVSGVQVYRKATAMFCGQADVDTVKLSADLYVKENGRFIVFDDSDSSSSSDDSSSDSSEPSDDPVKPSCYCTKCWKMDLHGGNL